MEGGHDKFKEILPLELSNDIDLRFKQRSKIVDREIERATDELKEAMK